MGILRALSHDLTAMYRGIVSVSRNLLIVVDYYLTFALTEQPMSKNKKSFVILVLLHSSVSLQSRPLALSLVQKKKKKMPPTTSELFVSI